MAGYLNKMTEDWEAGKEVEGGNDPSLCKYTFSYSSDFWNYISVLHPQKRRELKQKKIRKEKEKNF